MDYLCAKCGQSRGHPNHLRRNRICTYEKKSIEDRCGYYLEYFQSDCLAHQILLDDIFGEIAEYLNINECFKLSQTCKQIRKRIKIYLKQTRFKELVNLRKIEEGTIEDYGQIKTEEQKWMHLGKCGTRNIIIKSKILTIFL
jgi:hypothetical protein